MHRKIFIQQGQLLIEIMIVMGLLAIVLPAILTGLFASRGGKDQQIQRLEALSLLRETHEAVRNVREKGWTSFAVDGTYHPIIAGDNSWSFEPGPITLATGFIQQVVISPVYRNTLSGPIVNQSDPGAVLDLSTKKVDITISWTTPYTSSITSTLYLTRYLENIALTDTTQDQTNLVLRNYPFNAGTKSGVAVQASNPALVTDDGEVILGSGGHSNWCAPDPTISTRDLPKNGVANALYAIENNAFATTGENQSGVSFAKVDIPQSPPYPVDPTLAYTFDNYKTNGVFGEEDYAYIASDNNFKEVVIVDLKNVVAGKYQEVGHFDAPPNSDGKSVYVSANIGYVVVDDKLYNFDLSSKSGSRPKKDQDGVTLAGNGTNVVVKGGYAYVAIDSTSNQIQIVDISTDQTNLTVIGQTSVAGQGARDVFVDPNNDNAVYIVTAESSTQNEFFIIDTTVKSNPTPVSNGSYNTSPMDPKALTLVPGNRAILVGSGGEEYQVLNITSNPPIRCGGVQVDSGINDVASVPEGDGDAFSYILVATDPEFRVIAGGPGGGYSSSGTFESQTFNPGYITANNRLSATFSEPAGTNIEFQVSMANIVGGVCPTTGNYTFVGPSGTDSDRFNQASGEAITFPFGTYLNYTNPGQCIRYKVYFTGNGTSTPVLNDVTINYSP